MNFDELLEVAEEQNNSKSIDLIKELKKILGTEIVISMVPYKYKVVVRRLIRLLHRYNESVSEPVPAKKKKEEEIQSENLRRVFPKTENQESGKKFPGFEPLFHILVIGSTGSGKTTNLITMLFKGLFSQIKMDMAILNGGQADVKNVTNIRQACLYDIVNVQGKEQEDAFAYFHEDQFKEAKNLAFDHALASRSKLCIFDDAQASDGNEKVATLRTMVLQAKNANCTCVFLTHYGFKGKEEQIFRDAARYYVLHDQNQLNFNKLLGLKVNNPLYQKYSNIPEINDRVIIYDTRLREIYYGTHNYLDFNPILPSVSPNASAMNSGEKI